MPRFVAQPMTILVMSGAFFVIFERWSTGKCILLNTLRLLKY